MIKHGAVEFPGEDHLTYPLGYQDAKSVLYDNDVFVAVICDGCSTTVKGFTKNQVGAVLGADLISRNVYKSLTGESSIDFAAVLLEAEQRTLAVFRTLLDALHNSAEGFDKEEFVRNHLLFTVLGLVVVGDRYWFFGCGDGCYGRNETVCEEPSEKNVYLAENLWSELGGPQLKVHVTGRIVSSDILWISSDGLRRLFHRPSGKEDFCAFLQSVRTCSRGAEGNDTTIQPFRQLAFKQPQVFGDDVTVVVAKVVD